MENENNKEWEILPAMEEIISEAENSKMSDAFFEKCASPIAFLCSKLNITRTQSVLLSVFVEHSNDNNVFINEIATYLGCRTTRILYYANDIDVLVEKGYLRRRNLGSQMGYVVPHDVVNAFMDNQPSPFVDLSCPTLSTFFVRLAEIFQYFCIIDGDTEYAVRMIKELIKTNKHLSFVEKVEGKYRLNEANQLMLIVFCHLFVANSSDKVAIRELESVFDNRQVRRIRAELINGCTELQEKKLIEWAENDGFVDREYFRLTMNAKRELLDELNLPSLSTNRVYRGVIKATDITARNLFFSEEVTKNVGELSSLLEEDHFNSIRTRLIERGFRCGFSCLFYGAPGTGKTETVLQLARRSGRDVMQVNFSEIKSMWVGESEKNIKAVFSMYHEKVVNYSVTPILLFNEADAIFSKRRLDPERSVDKMENTIQNVILQEMESLDGILIATTNLVQNLDKAFERRFLYKLHFEKPSVEAQSAIWREMLPTLDEVDAMRLAKQYDFSGGEIENVARHFTIDTILHGDAVPTFQSLSRHCDQERIDQRGCQHIGFFA